MGVMKKDQDLEKGQDLEQVGEDDHNQSQDIMNQNSILVDHMKGHIQHLGHTIIDRGQDQIEIDNIMKWYQHQHKDHGLEVEDQEVEGQHQGEDIYQEAEDQHQKEYHCQEVDGHNQGLYLDLKDIKAGQDLDLDQENIDLLNTTMKVWCKATETKISAHQDRILLSHQDIMILIYETKVMNLGIHLDMKLQLRIRIMKIQKKISFQEKNPYKNQERKYRMN